MKQTFTIKDLPASERPRERIIEYGPRALSSPELIALLLGKGVKGESVLSTSQKLLSQFGSLEKLLSASLEDLQTIKGLGIAKACQIKACLEIARRINQMQETIAQDQSGRASIISPQVLASILRGKIGDYQKEHCIIASFDIRNKLIATDTIGIGILNANLIHPREVFSAAIKHHAASIIISHNHPSGDSEPSDEDIGVTERIKSAGKVIGIELLDHIIVTTTGYFSFKEQNLIQNH